MKEFLRFVVLDGLLLVALFYGVTFLLALIQQHPSVAGLTKKLERSRLVTGSLYATVAGAVTPFCSCSTIPIVSGMLRTHIRFGITMTFLMASPLVSESTIIVMGRYFGLGHTALFVGLAMVFPVVTGIGLDLLGFGRYVADLPNGEAIPGEVTESDAPRVAIPWRARARYAAVMARSELRLVAPYLAVGLLIGGLIYGFIPQTWIVAASDRIGERWLVPVMALLGAPLYFNMTAAVPIAFALTEKHLGLGPVVAFLVAGGGMSVPELVLLTKLFRPPLVVAYVVAMLAIAIAMGYVFRFVG